MKKILVILVFLFAPLSVFAMTQLADNELDEVSGQSGVSIVPNITMDIHFDVLAWGDSDGIGGSSTAGYVGVTDVSINGLSIGMRTDDYADMFPARSVMIDGRSFIVYDTGTSLEALRHPSRYQ